MPAEPLSTRDGFLLRVATDLLRERGQSLIDEGWRPELVVFAPDDPCLARIPGYKVALVVPIDNPEWKGLDRG